MPKYEPRTVAQAKYDGRAYTLLREHGGWIGVNDDSEHQYFTDGLGADLLSNIVPIAQLDTRGLDLKNAIDVLRKDGAFSGTVARLEEAVALIKPQVEQPAGRWAVIEDVNDVEWGRISDTATWRNAHTLLAARWKDLNVARVVSEGVE